MSSYKDPGFQERTALAAKARQKALDLLKSKPPVDEAVLAARREAAAAKEAAAIARRAEKAAEKQRLIEEKAAQAAAEIEQVEMSEAEKKAARDARYAARKGKKK